MIELATRADSSASTLVDQGDNRDVQQRDAQAVPDDMREAVLPRNDQHGQQQHNHAGPRLQGEYGLDGQSQRGVVRQILSQRELRADPGDEQRDGQQHMLVAVAQHWQRQNEHEQRRFEQSKDARLPVRGGYVCQRKHDGKGQTQSGKQPEDGQQTRFETSLFFHKAIIPGSSLE